MARLKGKVAVITGGANGIGRAICERFCEEGAIVIIADMNEVAGQQVAKTLGAKRSFFQLDVREKGQWNSLMKEVKQKHGKLDILVNNAGYEQVCPSYELTEETWDTIMETNLKGAFFAAQAAAHSMARSSRGGAIVNVCSLTSYVG